MKNFQLLYKKAFALSPERRLTLHANCGGVASALMTQKGNVFTGICIDASCGIGFCAEHAAIAEMLKSGESRIAEIIAVKDDKTVLSPCGRCREFIMQINTDNKNTVVHFSKTKIKRLSQLLPDNW